MGKEKIVDEPNTDAPFMQNREISWLRFNERVLEEAEDKTVPLFERLKFISIFTNNLDEFFMIRAGSLHDMDLVNGAEVDNKSGLTPKEQLVQIYEAVRPLYQKRDRLYKDVETQLRQQEIADLSYKELTHEERSYLDSYYESSILPLLSPQVVNSYLPFPHLNNKALHVGALLKTKKGEIIFGIIPVPSTLPDCIFLPDRATRFIAVDTILLEKIDSIFNIYEVEEKVSLCVTRNADINWEDEAYDVDQDFRNKMKKLLTMRKRLSVVRLELSKSISRNFKEYLEARLQISGNQIYVSDAPINMTHIGLIGSRLSIRETKELTNPFFTPQIPSYISDRIPMIRQVIERDILQAFPYESQGPFLRMIKEASTDSSVLSIKITIYRLSRKAKLVDYLCAAAENGKEVTVLIELKARFDEQNNIDWSEKLEEAGCTVLYGFENYKVHSKICLITMREKNRIKHITQVGTGNYNETTAELYTDYSLITANTQIGEDAVDFFKNMAIGNLAHHYSHLIVAPMEFKKSMIQLIDEEIAKGSQGRILFKINSLTDYDIIQKLSEASCAGVKIDMIIRGICCLLPGVPSKTENITVSSIVGRYLEHSRIYRFGENEEQKLYIASGDMMTRNMQRRVEVACPIYDPKTKLRINGMLDIMSHDTLKLRKMDSNGIYHKLSRNRIPINSQEIFMKESINEASNKAIRKIGAISSLLAKFRLFML